MNKYLVTVMESYKHTYLVEAESAEDAEKICAMESDGCDLTEPVDTEYESVLATEENLKDVDYDEL